MSQLKEGQAAPDFTLPSDTGENITLSDYRDKAAVVLYFYPKDMTPGCTQEACSFRDLVEDFKQAGAAILGVSADSLVSHEKFREKHHLNFPLLSDTKAEVATRYGVWQEKNRGGKKYMGIVRTTFVIDQEGVIRKIYPRVKVDEHADEVLEFVSSLG